MHAPSVLAVDYSGVFFTATGEDNGQPGYLKLTQNGTDVVCVLDWDKTPWTGSQSGNTITVTNADGTIELSFSDIDHFTGTFNFANVGFSGTLSGYRVADIFWTGQQDYRFEAMWPPLTQPWFFEPNAVAVGPDDNVYVLDDRRDGIIKLTTEGQVITGWGGSGYSAGNFRHPGGAAFDSDGNIYVVDSCRHRIQKFTPDGAFLTMWGSEGAGDGEFKFGVDNNCSGGIAIGVDDSVYVADVENPRIQKFSKDGVFITKWGSLGSTDGQFEFGTANSGFYGRDWGGLAVADGGFVYVADTGNLRIQKFDPDGNFISKWQYDQSEIQAFSALMYGKDGFFYALDFSRRIKKINAAGEIILQFGTSGSGDGELWDPLGLAQDKSGAIYVADFANYRIQKFLSDGTFLTKWGPGDGADEFIHANSILQDSAGNLFVLDATANRIVKLSPDGQRLDLWTFDGISGESVGRGKMAIDSHDNIYVMDPVHNQIHMYNPSGVRQLSWGGGGNADGQFYFTDPNGGSTAGGIAIDSNDRIYAVDSFNQRIQVFNTSGGFISKWGTPGTGDGQLDIPMGITVDANGFVYVGDYNNRGVQKFTSAGVYVSRLELRTWHTQDIGTDADGYLYVSDRQRAQILKFDANGQLYDRIGDGLGTSPGQFIGPHDFHIAGDGSIYVADRTKIQVFKKVASVGNKKAIIVSGGGAYPGNNLWDATQMNANFAYRALTYKGFTKQSIHYLTSDLDLDLDGNGIPDDVDGDANNAILQQAITTWAADADELTLYLVDHGGDGTFRMSGTENLSASDLDSWLDQLQATMPGKVTVIYDACESGSFVPSLTPPDGKARIVLTSTSPDESAYFVSQGSVSFSNFFWTHVFNGTTVKDAFDLSTQTVAQTTDLQNPLLDDDADGVGNGANDGQLAQATYIGNAVQVAGTAPVIVSVSGDQTINDQNWAELFADDVTDDDGIARVWAVIKPPDYVQGSAGNPVRELPGIDLLPVDGQPGRYSATYTNFSIPGTYYIAIYARDRLGNTAVPVQTTVAVNNPLRHKAIVIAGASDTLTSATAVTHSAQLAYQSLKFQGYSDDDIYLLSQSAIPGLELDGTANLAELADVMSNWAPTQTQDLLVYLVGGGGSQRFQINTAEALTAQTLDQQLDAIQATIPGRVTVVYDASESGSFLPVLTPPTDKERVVLTSAAAGQPAYFLVDGAVSFSTYFWIRILNGTPLYDAFNHARQSTVPFVSQVPQFDADGNGRGNEKSDRTVARYYTLGSGIMLAGDDPLIGSVVPDQTLPGNTTADIWAQDITTTGTIDSVWAVVSPPTHAAAPQVAPQVVNLEDGNGDGRYTGSVGNLDLYGTHTVAIYAMDTDGNVSLPAVSIIEQTVGPDVFEEDDTPEQARVIIVNGSEPRTHTFHDQGDADWVQFYAVANEWYNIQTENLGTACDTVVILYDENLNQLTNPDDLVGDAGAYAQGELISWQAPSNGIYYVKVIQYYPTDFGPDTAYDLKVYIPAANTPGMLTGQVTDQAGNPITGALVKTELGDDYFAALTLPNGRFLMPLPEGTFTVTAELAGHAPVSQSDVGITAAGTRILDWAFDMVYPGDVNGDGLVNLTDVVVILQTLSSMDSAGEIHSRYAGSAADVDGDGQAGLPDTVHILQSVAGIRD